TIADGNRLLTLSLTAPGGGAMLAPAGQATATLAIVDNEATLRFSSGAYSVSEATPVATITVLRTGPLAGTVTVQYATSDGTATAGADYRAVTGTLTFGVGVTSKTFTVPIINDALVEGPETVTLTLSNPGGGALLGTPSTAELTITDNDAGGAFQFSLETYPVSEPASGATPQTGTITVTRTGPAGATPGGGGRGDAEEAG